MAYEIERKFLVDVTQWRPTGTGVRYRQGYLCSDPARVVRVRLAGDTAFLTIKGPSVGIRRIEYEYPIPVEDAAQLIALCAGPLIAKTRHTELYQGRVFEIDVFHGDNDGLVLAEVELQAPTDPVDLPPWITQEVSEDPRYYNSNLIAHPYKVWHPRGGDEGGPPAA